jgi:hypothetical protein
MDTLYSRVAETHKKFMKETADSMGLAENQLVIRLIENLMHLKASSKEDFLDFLNGRGGTHKASEMLERMSWATHAFEKRHFAWAIEEYQRLSEEAPRADGVFRLAQYKLGYCWAEIADQLRLYAMEHGGAVWDPAFDAADWALCAALFYNARYSNTNKDDEPDLSKDPSHSVVEYNLACTWALRAQYGVERSLRGKARETRRKQLLRLRPAKASQENLPRSKKVDPVIAEFQQRAMRHLSKLSTRAPSKEPPTDAGVLIRRTETDADLSLLRSTDEFNKWSGTVTHGSIVTTFGKLQNTVPSTHHAHITRLHVGGAGHR